MQKLTIIIEALCWFATIIMGLAAGLRMLNLWLMQGESAPQSAAEAANIVAMVVVPYVFARAVRALRRLDP